MPVMYRPLTKRQEKEDQALMKIQMDTRLAPIGSGRHHAAPVRPRRRVRLCGRLQAPAHCKAPGNSFFPSGAGDPAAP